MTIENAAEQAASATSSDKDDPAAEAAKAKPITVPKARLDEEIQRRKAIEGELADVAEAMIEEVPEEYRALVPDLRPAQKVKWLRDAKAAGLFGGKARVTVPVTDTKAPTTTPKPEDTSKLS